MILPLRYALPPCRRYDVAAAAFADALRYAIARAPLPLLILLDVYRAAPRCRYADACAAAALMLIDAASHY